MGSLFGADHSSSFRFWGAATSGRLGRVTVLPQLKVDRLCSVVDGTAEFDPKPTVKRHDVKCRSEWEIGSMAQRRRSWTVTGKLVEAEISEEVGSMWAMAFRGMSVY